MYKIIDSYIYKHLIIFFLLFNTKLLQGVEPRYIDSKDHAVMISAEASAQAPSIKLKWQPNDLAISYEIHRKTLNSDRWQMPIATLTADENEYIDTNVKVGEVYEYQVSGYHYGSLIFRKSDSEGNPYDSSAAFYFRSYGYITVGIEAGPFDDNGVVLIIVDETLADTEFNEILDEYEYELMRDGWGIIRKYAPRAEKFDKDKVAATKYIIAAEQEDDPENIRSLLLFGRIPVPYSGDLAPDGHTEHAGAWPCDLFYGNFEQFLWTDFTVNTSSAWREENRNIPGDGKFDMSYFNNPIVEMQIGRVDFYDLPAFEETERELLKNYIKKNLKFRQGEFTIPYRGLVSDNFPAMDYEEGFASNGWRNLVSLLGADNVAALNFPNILKTEPYLWAYGCGSGGYNMADHIGTTKSFATDEINAVFTMLFGSYFGDWDNRDNFLRAAIATNPSVLTTSWTGRPPWYYHHLALGYPIAYAAKLSQNNFDFYKSNMYYMQGPDKPPNVYARHKAGIHTALMGDPTLRMFLNDVPAVSGLELSINHVNNSVQLTWNAINDEDIAYLVYKSEGKSKAFRRLSPQFLKVTEFTDITPRNGEQFYLVRAVKVIPTNAGLIRYSGPGALQKYIHTSIEDSREPVFKFESYPSPADNYIRFNFDLNKAADTKIEIYDINGRNIRQINFGNISGFGHSYVWDLNSSFGEKVLPGIYFAKITSGTNISLKKFVLIY